MVKQFVFPVLFLGLFAWGMFGLGGGNWSWSVARASGITRPTPTPTAMVVRKPTATPTPECPINSAKVLDAHGTDCVSVGVTANYAGVTEVCAGGSVVKTLVTTENMTAHRKYTVTLNAGSCMKLMGVPATIQVS